MRDNHAMRSRLLVVPVILLALLAAGCTSTKEVGVDAGEVTVEKGQTLVVDLGAVNSSIGDSWYLIETGDRAVLGEGDRNFDSDCKGGAVGCGGTLTYEFEAVGAGQTRLVFKYCYRSGPTDCDPGPGRGPAEPRTITVTVKA